MYLLKEIGYNHFENHHITRNGIRCCLVSETRQLVAYPGFWGETEILLGEFADTSKFEKGNILNKLLMTYANEYFLEDRGDNFKKIRFNVSTYQPDNIEGYIIFSKNSYNVKTNGEKLFQRYLNDIVVVLREGQYLEYDGGRVEVINGRLMLAI